MKNMFPILKLMSVGVVLHCLSASTLSCLGEPSSTPENLQSGIIHPPPLTLLSPTEERQHYGSFITNGNERRPFQNRRICPLCDSSVYVYCGEELLHDACCCTDPLIHQLPYQCKLADCRFLHANSCREHRLIATCCCSDGYRTLLNAFMKT